MIGLWPPGRLARPTAAVLVAASTALIYGQQINAPMFNPELALYYRLTAGMSWPQVFASYLRFDGGWYRPTATYLFHKAITTFVDWNDIAGLKLLSVGLVGLFALLVFKFSLTLFDDTWSAASGAILSIACPLFFKTAYLPTDVFDLLYQAVTISLAIFIVGAHRDPARSRRLRWLVPLGLAIALTCKEQALALLPFIGTLVLMQFSRRNAVRSQREHDLAVGFAASLATVALYLVAYAPSFRAYAGRGAESSYRVIPNVRLVFENAAGYLQITSRVFVLGHNRQAAFIQTHAAPAEIAIGVVALLLVTVFVASAASRADRRALLILGALLVSFAAIPIYSGGSPWQFGIPAIAYWVVVGRSLTQALASVVRWLRRPLAIAALGVVVVVSRASFATELQSGPWSEVARLHGSALVLPPRPPGTVPGDANIAVVSRGDELGPLVCSDLFGMVYQQPAIQQVLIPSTETAGLLVLASWIAADHRFAFEFVRGGREPKWTEVTSQFETAALARLRNSASPLAATGEREETQQIAAILARRRSDARIAAILARLGIAEWSASASNEYDASYSAANAIDGNERTAWAARGPGAATLWLRSQKPQLVECIRLRTRRSAALLEGWSSVMVSMSANGQETYSQTQALPDAQRQAIHQICTPGVQADRIELRFSDPVVETEHGARVDPRSVNPGFSEVTLVGSRVPALP